MTLYERPFLCTGISSNNGHYNHNWLCTSLGIFVITVSFEFCSIFLSEKYHDQRQIRGGKGLLHSTLPGHGPSLKENRAGTQGRNLKAETTEGHCMLACFVVLLGSCSASFLIQPRAF